MSAVVVKVGGSLLDLPDLTDRLGAYLESLRPARPLLIVGGGREVDRLREQDQAGQLTAEAAHWRAVEAMTANTQRVSTDLGLKRVATQVDLRNVERADCAVAMDTYALLREDEQNGGPRLPRCWSVTSDSIAVRLAHLAGADSILLLKSCGVPARTRIEQAVEQGVVDAYLPSIINGVTVGLVNFRQVPPRLVCQWS